MSLSLGPEALTRKEAAALLRIQPSTVAKWLRRGYLERLVIGNKWLVGLRSIREAQGKSFMWMKKGPYYDANRELVAQWVLAQLDSPQAARKQPSVSELGESDD